MEEALVTATVLTAIATVVLAGATTYLALKTRDAAEANQKTVEHSREMVEVNRATLEEMRAGREARERPHIRVEIDYDHLPWLYVVVRNVGGGPAASVRFAFTPDLITPANAAPRGEGAAYLSRELPMFSQGIDFLPAGAERSVWWGSGELIVDWFYEQNIERHGILVEIFYQGLDGEKPYQERMTLNPAAVWQAMRFRPLHLSRLVNPVIKAAEKIDKAISHDGYVKIKTATERKHELSAMWKQTMRQAEIARRESERQREEHNEEIRKRLEQNEQDED